nr:MULTISPECIES: ATP-binding cassette domain-containing protein [Nocardia]
MIEATNLTKVFGGAAAVSGVTFRVGPGRVTGFLGPNGSGKSTTMRMMLDLDRPTTGTVRVGGRRYRDRARARLGRGGGDHARRADPAGSDRSAARGVGALDFGWPRSPAARPAADRSSPRPRD